MSSTKYRLILIMVSHLIFSSHAHLFKQIKPTFWAHIQGTPLSFQTLRKGRKKVEEQKQDPETEEQSNWIYAQSRSKLWQHPIWAYPFLPTSGGLTAFSYFFREGGGDESPLRISPSVRCTMGWAQPRLKASTQCERFLSVSGKNLLA